MIKTVSIGFEGWSNELDQLIGDGYSLFATCPPDRNGFALLILHKENGAVPPAPIPKPAPPPKQEIDTSLEGFKAMVKAGDFLVLDTETTGLNDGEICEISIIDADGQVLFDSLVKTTEPIPAEATAIHGITDNMVKPHYPWKETQPIIRDILRGCNVVIYNATYDRKMMHKSDERAGLPHCDYKAEATYWDAMGYYAEHWGDWNEYHDSYTWQSLFKAARQQGVEAKDAHRALGDCLTTLEVIKAMVK